MVCHCWCWYLFYFKIFREVWLSVILWIITLLLMVLEDLEPPYGFFSIIVCLKFLSFLLKWNILKDYWLKLFINPVFSTIPFGERSERTNCWRTAKNPQTLEKDNGRSGRNLQHGRRTVQASWDCLHMQEIQGKYLINEAASSLCSVITIFFLCLKKTYITWLKFCLALGSFKWPLHIRIVLHEIMW